MKLAVRGMSQQRWEKLAAVAIRTAVHKQTGGSYRNTAAEAYMLGRLRGNRHISARQIAKECIKHHKLSMRMLPWGIKTAQRLKHRLAMQEIRRNEVT